MPNLNFVEHSNFLGMYFPRFFKSIIILLTIILSINICCSSESEYSNNKIKDITVYWYNTDFAAIDIGVGSKGDVFVIGIDKNLYYYELKTNNFILIEKDFTTLET